MQRNNASITKTSVNRVAAPARSAPFCRNLSCSILMTVATLLGGLTSYPAFSGDSTKADTKSMPPLSEPRIIYIEGNQADDRDPSDPNAAPSEVEFDNELRAYLDKVKAEMKNSSHARLKVSALNDSSGQIAANVDVSRQRAVAVANQLYDYGFKKNQIVVASKGADDPVAQNENETVEDDSVKKQRVELRFLSGKK